MVPDKPQFFVTSSRPGNFGDHIDLKVNIDNWFEENRYGAFEQAESGLAG